MYLLINGQRYNQYFASITGFEYELTLKIISENFTTASPITENDNDWIEISVEGGIEYSEETISITVSENETQKRREGIITFAWDNNQLCTIIINQDAASQRHPIWEDVYLETAWTPEGKNHIEYKISTDEGEVVFVGRAYKMPNEYYSRIPINNIVSNYLNNNDILPLLDGTVTSVTAENAFRIFEISSLDDSIIFGEYAFLYDWSYMPWDGGNKIMSNPINGHYTDNMLKMETELNDTVVINKSNSALYSIPSCGDYALYYLNKFGGWDSFLIEGNVSKSKTVTHHSLSKAFNNNTLEYENKTYLNEMVTSYVLNTNYLTDEQSINLADNLLTSIQIYLHDLRNDKILPVNITDTKIDYKTYQNQGKKMVNYQINIKESQTKIRK